MPLPTLRGAIVFSTLLLGNGAGQSPPESEVKAQWLESDSDKVWQVGQPLPIAVEGGQTRFDLPNLAGNGPTLVVVSVLDPRPGPFPMHLQARPLQFRDAQPLPFVPGGSNLELKSLKGPEAPFPDAISSSPKNTYPAIERVFHLMVRDGHVASASNYEAVASRLRAVGERVQVYVDSSDLGRVSDVVLRAIVSTFDETVYPTASRLFGAPASDPDGDGRFTVFLSSKLNRLADGRLRVDGFVRCSDLDPKIPAPFGNACDMLYLNASIEPGDYLQTLLAHEYTHAVLSSIRKTAGLDHCEEESWLDEAVAHLAEDLHGFSKENLDYRVSAFLSAPERYRLVVEDYQADNLFRCHGCRGSTFLFLKWCEERCGPGLLSALARSGKSGVANIEAATGASFAELFRGWTTEMALAHLKIAEPNSEASSFDPSLIAEGWPIAGPRTTEIVPGGSPDRWLAAGTSPHFTLITPGSSGAIRVEVEAPPDVEIQVTAIPLPDDLPRLHLSIHRQDDREGTVGVVAHLSEQDGLPVRLTSFSWEPIEPTDKGNRSNRFRFGKLEGAELASAFGGLDLPSRGRFESQPIDLGAIGPEHGPIVFKVIGLDRQGRRVAAWADLE